MQYRNLGRTGLKVSVLSFGAWVTFGKQVDVEQAKQLMLKCYEGGVNFFDNAEVYAGGLAETVMGQAIKELGWKRSDLVISTKIFWGGSGVNDKGLSRKHLIEGLQASLKRLQMDYVDVLFCHRPDDSTPIEETVRAMNYLLEQGKIFYWGTSEWSAAQITQACEIAKRLHLVPPIVEQPEYHMFERTKVEVEFAPLYEEQGIGLTTWSPLASGVLTGKYSEGKIPEGSRLALDQFKAMANKKLVERRHQVEKVDQLRSLAAELGCSLAQLALAWCAANPHVSTVIMGASKVAQIEDNLKAMEVLPKLTPEVMEKIESIIQSKP
eukprot:evm.model.scf_1759.2 EVM.evm.TU.scf_1759.2   scf_1759:4266-10307(-)